MALGLTLSDLSYGTLISYNRLKDAESGNIQLSDEKLVFVSNRLGISSTEL